MWEGGGGGGWEHLGPYMPGSWWWWLFPRLRGFWENVRPFISRLLFVFVFVFVFEVEIRSRALIPLFYARVSPQWLSELRRLWPNVP